MLFTQLIFMFTNINCLRYVHAVIFFLLLQVCYLDFECLYQNESRFSTVNLEEWSKKFCKFGAIFSNIPTQKSLESCIKGGNSNLENLKMYKIG